MVALIKTSTKARPAPKRGNPRDQFPPPERYQKKSSWMREATCPEGASKKKRGQWRRRRRCRQRNQRELRPFRQTATRSRTLPAGGTGRQTPILNKIGRKERRNCKRWKLLKKDLILRCIQEMKTCLWSNKDEAEGDSTNLTQLVFTLALATHCQTASELLLLLALYETN